MKFYCIFTDQSGLDGVPIYLESRLWEEIPPDPMAPVTKEYNYPWATMKYEKVKFPDKLFFVVKAPKISFDLYWYRCGYVCSNEFKDLMQEFNDFFESVPLEVTSNRLKTITKKNYWLVKFYKFIDAIDYNKSSFETLKNQQGADEYIEGIPWVTKFNNLVLNADLIRNQDLFCLNSGIFGRNLFCSENFKNIAEKKKVYGITFIPYEDACDFMNFSGYLGKQTYDRLKNFSK